MPRESIKATLTKLHEELAGVEDPDPALKELLREVDEDIHALIGEEAPEDDALSQAVEKLEALETRFAARYPQTEKFFQELVATLGRLGI